MTDLITPSTALVSSRRLLLSRAGGVALSGVAIALLAGCESMATSKNANAAGDAAADDVATLNVALGLEYQAIAAYQVGAESGLLQKPVLAVAVQFQGDHKKHAEVLASTITKLGGKPVTAQAKYDFPVASLKTQADVLQFAAGLEQGAASAYLSTVPSFSNRDLAKAAASIMGDETMHWAVLRNALGQNPVPSAFIA